MRKISCCECPDDDSSRRHGTDWKLVEPSLEIVRSSHGSESAFEINLKHYILSTKFGCVVL